MKYNSTFCFAVLTLFAIGCVDRPSQSVVESGIVDEARKSTILQDIEEPDAVERTVDQIVVIGSALTDEHVDSIRSITDETEPKNSNRYLIRKIQHTGPNKATNIWQTGHMQIYQKLQLVDGKWVVEEEGGGFGQW